jgi:dipeptide transport system ATP-binding protein
MNTDAAFGTAPGNSTLAAPLLVAEGLTREYRVRRGLFKPPGVVKALAGVSFSVSHGRTLAVVGESGCGKSTLARVLTMIEPPTAGRLRIDGVDVAHADAALRKALRPRVQIVFQNPFGSLNPRQTIGSTLEEPLLSSGSLGAEARRQAALDMMQRVGLRAEWHGRYPHMFSGGQRQRIAIARALMTRPQILVLDEPVSALDVSIRAQVLNLLMDLQQEFGLAYVFISHDLSVVRHVADEVLVMYLGRAVEHASRDAIFSAPAHPYTQALLSATPVADPRIKRDRIVLQGELPSPFDPPSGCAFHPRCRHVQARCSQQAPPTVNGSACWLGVP